MSRENVELVARFNEILNRRDAEGAALLLDPEVEIDLSRRLLDARVAHGRDGFLKAWADLIAPWEEHSIELEELIDLGDDRVLALERVRGKGRTSGAEVDARVARVYVIRDGLIRHITYYAERSEALRDAGVARA
jgi:ketosteroid isomerase-like protein